MSIPPGIKIKDTDKGWKNFKKAIQELDGLRANVGYWGGKTHNDSGLPMVYLAAIHEYGTEKIPSRPFLRTARDNAEKENYIGQAILPIARQVISGRRDAKSLLRYAANKFRDYIKRTMDMSPTWATPLAASTLANRAIRSGVTDNVPLEVTLELRDSIQVEILNKGGKRT